MVGKYHVHIYKVIAKAEVDTLAYNGAKAKEIAIDAVKSKTLNLGESDCELIAIEFEVVDKEKARK